MERENVPMKHSNISFCLTITIADVQRKKEENELSNFLSSFIQFPVCLKYFGASRVDALITKSSSF